MEIHLLHFVHKLTVSYSLGDLLLHPRLMARNLNRSLYLKLNNIIIDLKLMSSLDYYNLLELPRNATQEEIQLSFKRLGQKYNPNSNLTN